MSQARDSGATSLPGSHDRLDWSSLDWHSEPTGQTGGSDWSNADWLQQRIDHYRAHANDMYEAIEHIDDIEKLGQGFTLADPLEKLDLGDGAIPRPVFVNQFDYQLSIKPI